MARSGIEISGDLDTWIRELPNLGRASEMRDAWADVTHKMLLSSREHTHVITGQLFSTSYSLTRTEGATKVEGQLWWPAQNPRDGYHYAYYEFKKRGGPHDAPEIAFLETYDSFIDAIGKGLEDQVRGWR